jgi:ABC-type dipeptide/oligopeptide/nickel transport system permease subunit
MPSGVSIVAITLSVTFIGEGLRVALDPHRIGLK